METKATCHSTDLCSPMSVHLVHAAASQTVLYSVV